MSSKRRKVAHSRLQTRSGAHALDAIAVIMMSVNPVSYIARSPRLLAQLQGVLCNKYYSLRTEEA
jgi:hypothetical protein